MKPARPVLVQAHAAHGAARQERVFAQLQPEFQPLPALVGCSTERRVTSRWRLSLRERLRVAWRGNLYIQQLTYGYPLQAILPSIEEPDPEDVL